MQVGALKELRKRGKKTKEEERACADAKQALSASVGIPFAKDTDPCTIGNFGWAIVQLQISLIAKSYP